MKLHFIGAANEVTGSGTILTLKNKKIMVDCGMFQSGTQTEEKNSAPWPVDPREISTVLITHAHLDHVGRLPKLVKDGFTGFIYATAPTSELIPLILNDAYNIMRYRHEKNNTPLLYDEEDIAQVMAQLKKVEYYEPTSISPDEIRATFYDAGHIFGSAFIHIETPEGNIVFSGDVGNEDMPIVRETDALPENLTALVCESTYGNRVHSTVRERASHIKTVVKEALAKKGVIMIPAFSLERTQELLYYINILRDEDEVLAEVPIFLDSPLAIAATRVYRAYPRYFDKAAKDLLDADGDLFNFPNLTVCETREDSKKINHTVGPKIIIAGGGMMEGGRILHHALRYVSDEHNTLIMVGYQAEGTLGRAIQDGQKFVHILDERVEVNCRVVSLDFLSAHADQAKLMRWILQPSGRPQQVILNHGDVRAAVVLKDCFLKGGIRVVEVGEPGKDFEI